MRADISIGLKYVIIGIVICINIWFWVLWAFVALSTFKYKFTLKVSKLLRRVVCRRINDIDLIPVDEDAIA